MDNLLIIIAVLLTTLVILRVALIYLERRNEKTRAILSQRMEIIIANEIMLGKETEEIKNRLRNLYDKMDTVFPN